MNDDKIAEIRARHNAVLREKVHKRYYSEAHNDRAALLAEVEKLRADNARLRAQVAEYFAEPDTHPVEDA